jgi:hypothetical protein
MNKILLMDMNSLPNKYGWNFEIWMNILKEHGVCIYNSEEGESPELVNSDTKIKFIDIDSQEANKYLENVLS